MLFLKNIKIKKCLILITLAFLIINIGGCGAAESSDSSQIPDEEESIVIPVTVQELTPQTLEKTIALGSLLRPKEEVVLLGGGTGSRIEEIYVEVGSKVTKGQIILTQDLRDLEIQQNNLELTYQDLLDNLEKTRSLYEAGAAAESQVTALESQLKQLELQMENLALAREKMEVRSTISGIISSIPVVEGQMASAQTPVATVVNIDSLLLDLRVGENYIGNLKKGQTIEVTVPALENKTFQGKITSIPPSVDPVTKAYTVTVEIPNAKHEAKGGMYAEVNLVVARQENALAIPQFAIVERDGKSIVYVVEDNQARVREVEVGLTLGDLAEITSGLEAGDKVIVEGQYTVSDGIFVSIVQDNSEAGDGR